MSAALNLAAAQPRRPEEIATLPDHPSIAAAAEDRGITCIVHFTRMRNLVGILVGLELLARSMLTESQLLELVRETNCNFRRDPAWVGYISMSVGRVNPHMLTTSLGWHPEESNPWVVLEYTPEILGHRGVVFTSTNNSYPEVVRREGMDGFELMFSDSSTRWTADRQRANRGPAEPTDTQAEVLYPYRLAADFLTGIVVTKGEHAETVTGILSVESVPPVPVRIDEGAFS